MRVEGCCARLEGAASMYGHSQFANRECGQLAALRRALAGCARPVKRKAARACAGRP